MAQFDRWLCDNCLAVFSFQQYTKGETYSVLVCHYQIIRLYAFYVTTSTFHIDQSTTACYTVVSYSVAYRLQPDLSTLLSDGTIECAAKHVQMKFKHRHQNDWRCTFYFLTVSRLLEVHIGIAQWAPGNHVTTNPNWQDWSGRAEFLIQHSLRDIRVQVADIERSHRITPRGRCVHFSKLMVFERNVLRETA